MFIDSDFFEILILALIAAIIAYKFYTILGEDHGIKADDLTINPQYTASPVDNQTAKPEFDRIQDRGLVPESLHQAYEMITDQYPEFNISTFLQGATLAFEMIVKAYTTNDYTVLKSLTDEKTYVDFESAMQDRAARGHRLVTSIIKIEPLIINDLSLNNTDVTIKVKYVSEQTNILYDESSNIIEGSLNQSEQVTDIWTYQRHMNSKDPNWVLVDTGN